MDKTKDQQAQEYADSIQFPFGFSGGMVDFITDVAKSAWLDGYTAAEQSMWRSVEEEQPEDNILVVVWIFGSTVLTDFCEDGKWHYSNVRFWMPIPSLPDTNTEKHDNR